jgi:glycerol-3-phosphate acyltransferase PlsX
MGSDSAPAAEVVGAMEAVRSSHAAVVLVGPETSLREELRKAGVTDSDRIEVRHAEEVITMHDPPSMAVKQKKQSSMRIAFDLMKAGDVDAVVSAGNSGALMACGLFVLGRLRGVDRPAIVTTFPTPKGLCALLDMGANVDPKPEFLAQFAAMGAVFARVQHRKARPRVGLLSNGTEEHKGTSLTRDTHHLLERARERSAEAAFDYVGYVEGRDIFQGIVDVVVTDGFTGNVLLKSSEGVVEAVLAMVRSEVLAGGALAKIGAWLMKPALRKLARKIDYAETGGAPLVGVDGVVVIAHGGSDARAIKNAIAQAEAYAQAAFRDEIENDITRHAFLWQSEPPEPLIPAGKGLLS